MHTCDPWTDIFFQPQPESFVMHDLHICLDSTFLSCYSHISFGRFLPFPKHEKDLPSTVRFTPLPGPTLEILKNQQKKQHENGGNLQAGNHAVVTFWSGKLARVLGNLGRPGTRGEKLRNAGEVVWWFWVLKKNVGKLGKIAENSLTFTVDEFKRCFDVSSKSHLATDLKR